MTLRSSLAIFFSASAVLALACDSSGKSADASAPADKTPPGAAEDPGVSSCSGSANPIDVAVCPRMREDGCESRPRATTRELCRRLFIDLTGVAPTDADVASTCAGKSAAEIAATLIQTKAYVTHAEELWAEKLAYDPAQVDGKWLADADRLVANMVTGAMSYDDFAKRIIAHPVMGIGARLPRSDVVEDDASFYPQVAERVMRLFLGRPPIAGEGPSFAKLFRPWKKHIVVLNGDYGRAEVMLDPGLCACASTVLGATTRIELPFGSATAYEDIPPALQPAVQAELEKPGALIVASGPFLTQAVDLALSMYLGWWKSTPGLDASMLPEVEVALAERFRAQRSWPELVQDIVTSTLYVRSNRLPDEPSATAEPPAWCAGPLRVLRPEALIASLGHALDVRVGRCDHRTYEPRDVYYDDGSEGAFFPYALREDEDSDYTLFGTRDFFLEAAGTMGGCVAGAPRTEDPTLTATFGAPGTVATICAAWAEGLEDVPSGDVTNALGDRVAHLLLQRPLSGEEKRALGEDVAASGSARAHEVATLVCSAIARSIELRTY